MSKIAMIGAGSTGFPRRMKTSIAAIMMIGLIWGAIGITADTGPSNKAGEAPTSGAATAAEAGGASRLAGDRDYYFVLRTDDKDGAGTMSDPCNGTGYARFDRLMRSIPPDSIIHLSPGVYETEGGGFDQACQNYEPAKGRLTGHGFKLRPGWTIDGGNPNTTTIRLTPMTVMPVGWDPVINYNTVLMTNDCEEASRRGGIVIKNLTIDGNFQHQPYEAHPLRVEAVGICGYIRNNQYNVPNCVLDNLYIKNMGCRRMDGLHTPELFEVCGVAEGGVVRNCKFFPPVHGGGNGMTSLMIGGYAAITYSGGTSGDITNPGYVHGIEVCNNTFYGHARVEIHCDAKGHIVPDPDGGGLWYREWYELGISAVDTQTEALTLDQPHLLATGDQVKVSTKGTLPVATPALKPETIYYVHVLQPNTLTLHASLADAKSGANPINFRAAGTGRNCLLHYEKRYYASSAPPPNRVPGSCLKLLWRGAGYTEPPRVYIMDGTESSVEGVPPHPRKSIAKIEKGLVATGTWVKTGGKVNLVPEDHGYKVGDVVAFVNLNQTPATWQENLDDVNSYDGLEVFPFYVTEVVSAHEFRYGRKAGGPPHTLLQAHPATAEADMAEKTPYRAGYVYQPGTGATAHAILGENGKIREIVLDTVGENYRFPFVVVQASATTGNVSMEGNIACDAHGNIFIHAGGFYADTYVAPTASSDTVPKYGASSFYVNIYNNTWTAARQPCVLLRGTAGYRNIFIHDNVMSLYSDVYGFGGIFGIGLWGNEGDGAEQNNIKICNNWIGMYKDVPYYNGNSQYGGMSLSKIRNAVIEGNTIDLRQQGSYCGIALSDSDRVVIRNNTFTDDFTEGKGKDQPKHIWVDEKSTNITRSGNITRLGASVDP